MTYRNSLATAADLHGWVAEGPVGIEHTDDGMRLFSTAEVDMLVEDQRGEDGHFTLWCPEVFGPDVEMSWDVQPLAPVGLAMLFFAATGTNERDLFDPALAPRSGRYVQYHSGDIRTLHVSYYRRRWPSERRFRTCNLRKSPGLHLVAQGADPIPPAPEADGHYRVRVTKRGREVRFAIDDLELFHWIDDGETGPPLGGGRIGFRQMAPLVAHYRNLEVRPLA